MGAARNREGATIPPLKNKNVTYFPGWTTLVVVSLVCG